MAARKKEITEFGEFLVQMISEAKMFKSDFYDAVGINKPYFYEILTSNAPPQETLEKMMSVLEDKLGYDEKRRHTFYNLAAKSRQEIPADINDLIKSHPEEWGEIRTALLRKFAAQG